MNKHDILVLGRMYPNDMEPEIVRKTKGMASSAANAHLKKIIEGLDSNLESPVHIINVMPLGSYPKRYEDLFVKGFEYSHTEGAEDVNVGFCNLTVWKKISIKHSLYRQIRLWAKKNPDRKKIIIAYTPSRVFLQACKKIKKIFPDCHVCVIVPDLPAYTDVDKGNSLLYKIVVPMRVRSTNRDIAVADSFVFISEWMAEYYKTKKPYMVMEGLVDACELQTPKSSDIKYVTFTGALTRKYCVMDMVHAFCRIPNENYRLVLCGGGDCEKEIAEIAQKDRRILLKGMVSRAEAIEAQRNATILIGPRNDEGEATKYMFPSKILEYMGAGRPVLCFKLKGIPHEYDAYLTYFSSRNVDSMARDIESLCEKSDEELNKIGRQSYEFVMREKNNRYQAKKMLDMIMKKHILFVNNTLDAGGTTTSLLSVLYEFDYTKYHVDLILLRNTGAFIDVLPKEVHLLAQALEEGNPYLAKLKKLLWYTFSGYLFRAAVYKYTRAKQYKLGMYQLMSGMARCSMTRKLKTHYDTVIGYMECFANNYARTKVQADHKIAYVHVNYTDAGCDPQLDAGTWSAFEKIMFVSEDCKKDFDREFPNEKNKTFVIENMLSEKIVRKRAQEPITDCSFDAGYFHIITAARLDNRHKRIDRAIKTCMRLKQDGYPVRWYVLGDGEDREMLKQLIHECNVEDCFFMLGNKKNVYPYIKQADLFVLPSQYEGKPMVVTEAKLLGTPVVATEYSSVREQISDGSNGLIAENNDGESLYTCVKRILEDKQLLEKFRDNLANMQEENDINTFYRTVLGAEGDNGVE